QEQIADTPGELGHLVNFAARRVVGDAEGPEFGSVAKNWIRKNLGMKYPWPGNFRELEQCLRNLAIRGSYAPAEARSRPAAEDSSLWTRLEAGQLTADALMTEVCTRLYDRIGNYGEVARRLGVDRRTVRKYVSAGADVPGA